MTTLSGNLRDVTMHSTAAREVLVRATEVRAQGQNVTTRENQSVPVGAGGEVSFECEPGPAVMLIVFSSGAPVEVRMLVAAAGEQGLGDAALAAGIAPEAELDVLEQLSVEVAQYASHAAESAQQAIVAEAAAAEASSSAIISAAAAAGSSDAANQSKVDAAASASAAAGSEQAASQSVAAAGNSKSAAETAATQATASASAALESKNSAQTSAQSAANSATTAAETLAGKADLIGGSIPTSQLPALALTKPNVVANRTAMLAITAQEGDVAVITGTVDKGTYMLGTGPSTSFSSWIALTTPDAPVQSVNGQTGTVNLSAANVGAAASTHTHTTAQVSGLDTALAAKASTAAMNSRPALFSGTGAPPSSIPGAVAGDWYIDTSTMQLYTITGT